MCKVHDDKVYRHIIKHKINMKDDQFIIDEYKKLTYVITDYKRKINIEKNHRRQLIGYLAAKGNHKVEEIADATGLSTVTIRCYREMYTDDKDYINKVIEEYNSKNNKDE